MKITSIIRHTPLIVRWLFYLSAAVLLIFIISGYGYRWQIWSLNTAFMLLSGSAVAATGLMVLSIGAFLLVYNHKTGKGYIYLLAGLVCTVSVFAFSAYWYNRVQIYPPIHDITTDFEQPPEFQAIVPLRADAPNPPEYEGNETADMQQEAYPDLAPLFLTNSYEDVYEAVVYLAEQRGWELVERNREAGRVEATEKLPWFGFEDDIVIRIDTIGVETRVDMRSKSRVGRSDLGVNARRIKTFFEDLEQRVSAYSHN